MTKSIWIAVLGLCACKDTIEHGTPDAGPPGGDARADARTDADAIVEVAVGWEHGCVRYGDLHVACWGSNARGEATPPTGGFTQITAGRNTSCGLVGPEARCWSAPEPAGTPVEVFAAIAAAEDDACGIGLDGNLRCWGQGSVTPPTGNFKQLSGGWRFFCGIRADDSVTCWGEDYGTVGVPPPGGAFVQVSAAHESVCGLRQDRTIECWGGNDEGQLPPPGITETFDQIAAGERLTCGLRPDRTVVCWGTSFGLDDGPDGEFVAIDANTDVACGIKTDGTAICWDGTTEISVP